MIKFCLGIAAAAIVILAFAVPQLVSQNHHDKPVKVTVKIHTINHKGPDWT
jgi:hypothetical protein